MRLSTVLLCACLLAPTGKAGAATRVVPAGYPTIQAAIDAAAPGDTVLLKPGQYQESVVIDGAITLKGEKAGQVLIHNTVLAGEIVKIISQETARVENIIAEHTDSEPANQNPRYPDLLLVAGGRAEVNNCIFRNGAGCGVAVASGGVAFVKNCTMEKNVQTGLIVRAPNSACHAEKNTISENAWGGILCFDHGSGEFIDNTIIKNGRTGIFITGPAPEGTILRGNRVEESADSGIEVDNLQSVTLESNVAVNNGRVGIMVNVGSRAVVRLNICQENGEEGIKVGGVLAQAGLEENMLIKNRGDGISVVFGAQARIDGNTSRENGGSGIAVEYWDSVAEITRNVCAENRRCGIAVSLGAESAVNGNTCSDNGGYGVKVADEATKADVGQNTTERNGDQPSPEDLPVSRQPQVDPYYIGWALSAGQFDHLDRVASRLRAHQCRFPEGGWQLEYFYRDLLNGYGNQSCKNRQPYLNRVKEWGERVPASITARVLMARMYVEFAWQERGNGAEKETAPEAMQNFKQYLREAERVLVETEKGSFAQPDPELYSTWIWVGTGLGFTRDEMEALLTRGATIDPGYYPLYTRGAAHLMPHRHGSAKELKEYFAKVHGMTRASSGDAIYAMLVGEYLGSFTCDEVARGEVADWDTLESACRRMLQDFPESDFYLNQFCKLACWHQKRDVAAELFAKIGDTPDSSVWGKNLNDEENRFHRLQRWATAEDAPHPCQDKTVSSPISALTIPPDVMRRYLLTASALIMGLSFLATAVIVAVFGGKAMRPPTR